MCAANASLRRTLFLACGSLLLHPLIACANIPGGGTGTGADVTLTTTPTTATLSNGIVSIQCIESGASLDQVNYTYNNGSGSITTQMLAGGTDGGEFYWDTGGFGTGTFNYSVVVDPSLGDANHARGDYAEIDLLSSGGTNGAMDVHYSMLRGSPGFYVTVIWSHRSTDAATAFGEARSNVYAGSPFNWLNVDSHRNKLMEVPSGSSVAVPGAPPEVYLWTSGLYQGLYEDKYKYSADLGVQRAWGWGSVGAGALNVGMWNVSASAEYKAGGPMKRENMCHIGTTILNVHNSTHYGLGTDEAFAAGEVWTKVYGPYFVYCNNVSNTITDPTQADHALYSDALAQAGAEATAWPYSWFDNASYSPAANRGTVTGRLVINDTYNPSASGSNLWVGVEQQPFSTTGVCDFQQWTKPYEFWVKTDSNGNFTIPSVISGSNYTLYAFGPGAAGTFQSQPLSGGGPPNTVDIPASPFSVTVNSGSTTALGTVTWTPTRVGPTVFELGYPDRTGDKFRHGEDYWVGDIGPNPNAPSPVWSKFLEFPFDFPNGLNYVVGQNRWTTDWNFVQPTITDSAANYDGSTSTITFNLASAPAVGSQASLYIAQASNFQGPLIVQVNGTNIAGVDGYDSAYSASLQQSDATIREGIHGCFSDNRITFAGSLLQQGANTITLNMRKGGVITNHAMYDYLRLELTGYVPPAPASVAAYAGNDSILVCWPAVPGAMSYNILRSTTNGSGYTRIAANVLGPVCGSGPANATYLDTTAANGTTYYYVVQSVNPAGASANSPQSPAVAPSAGSPAAAPAAPTGLTATPGNAAVTLNWTASAGANYYTVQRSTLVNTGVGTFNTLRTITLNNNITGTTYTDSSPTNGSIYTYTVVPSNVVGGGSAATTANVTPVPTAPTAAPTAVTAAPGAEEVTLTWAPVTGAVGYVIEVATSPGGPFSVIASVPSLTYTDSGLDDNTAYYYEVEAVNSAGSGAISSVASATTALPPPGTLTAAPGNTQITLSWTPVAGATSYSVQRGSVTGGPYTVIGVSDGSSYTDDGLTNGTPYYYVVATTNANGTGVTSVEATATPITTVPVAPANLTATPGNEQVILNWTASVGATSYIVREATNSGGPYTTLDAAVTGATYTNTGLANGTTYYYVVAPTDSGGTGANSNEASATPAVVVNLTWYGGISTAWDTATANWRQGAGSALYADGDTVSFDDTAATSTVVITGSFSPASVTFDNSILNYTVSGTNGGLISGITGLVKSGSANLILAGSNTFTGSTAITGGTLTLANTQALLDSTLNYNSQGGTLSFGLLTSSTFAGLSGAEALSLTNTGGVAVTLAVGNGGSISSYSGGMSGAGGSLTKIGTGTLTLTGSNSYSGATTTSGGILSISTGAIVNGAAAGVTSGQLQINGGSLTSGASSNITAGSGGVLVNSGTASFNGGLTTDPNVDDNIFVGVTGGALNMASLYLGRSGLAYTSQPAAGATTTGLYVNGGAATIVGALNVCTGNSNSSGSVRIDSGALTVDSTTTITLNNGDRWSVLDVNGGIFTSNDSTGAGIQLGGVFGGENSVFLVRNGVANTDKITFGDANQTSGSDLLTITGGILYVGSGGMVAGGTGAYASSISLSGAGTLAALASWSSSLNMTLGGDTIQASDANGVGHNITLSGTLTGTSLLKTGNGTLLLAGPCSYTGATTISAGILEITGTVSNTSSVVITSGATCYLAGGSLTVSGAITNNGIFKISGTPALALTGSFTNNAVLDLINGPSTLPPNFVNHGTVLDAANVTVQQAGMTGATFNLSIQSYLQHTYQLQRAGSLTNPTWTNVGSPQTGTGSTLNFSDPAATGTQGFYRVLVSS
jgi:autotransporter-associated beta strand protein